MQHENVMYSKRTQSDVSGGRSLMLSHGFISYEIIEIESITDVLVTSSTKSAVQVFYFKNNLHDKMFVLIFHPLHIDSRKK